VDIDSLFFPDAISANELSSSEIESPTDDSRAIDSSSPLHAAEHLTEGDSASIPPHSPLRHAVDPSGEIGDSLTEEMMGDLKLDLEQPYRPNISSYDASGATSAFSKDAARIDQDPPKQYQSNQSSSTRPKPHPSASTPSFQSLAIFTGEEERFAFKRAVSRVHEMSSPEFLLKAEWTPMKASFRTWERPANISPSRSTVTSPKHTIGEAQPLDETKLSGVLSPSDLRAKYPEGMPKHSKEVEVDRSAKSKRPAKKDVNIEDPRRDTEPPVHRVHHVWG
jgi:protein AFG1